MVRLKQNKSEVDTFDVAQQQHVITAPIPGNKETTMIKH